MGNAAQAFRFLISGGAGFALYYALALLLRRHTGWPDGTCATVATLAAVLPVFFLQKHFTFRRQGDAGRQLLGYVLLQGASSLLVGAVAQLCMQLGLSHFLGFFLGGVAGVLLSYAVQSRLIFHRGQG